MPTTFLELQTAIKKGRIDRSGDLDNMVKRLINEIMIKHTRNKEYPELFIPSHVLTVTANEQSQFTLPTDFAKVTQVQYSNDNGITYRYLRKQSQYGLPFLSGSASWWYIAGSSLHIYPYKDIDMVVDQIRISYFKIPPALVNDEDLLLVDDLYPIIVNEALSRVRKYHQDYAGGQAYQQSAVMAETTKQDE